MEGKNTNPIAVLVVHGVGEQGRFEQLEAMASQFKLALEQREPGSLVHTEIHAGDNTPRRAAEHAWRDSPVTLHWHRQDGQPMTLVFREAHWADLDQPSSFWRWVKLAGWSLSVSGVHRFLESEAGTPDQLGMRNPGSPGKQGWLKVRAALFLVSFTFLLLLCTVGVADQVLKRLSWRLPLFTRLLTLIYNYLGDVKLYQDWIIRHDERMEVIGGKSRFAILRRMNRVLVNTAAEVERGELAGFYILSHSLGTVIAFNSLMDLEVRLPHALAREEWDALPETMKEKVSRKIPKWIARDRPQWLDDGAPWREGEERARDVIPREKVFAGLKGFMTMGSPLDKFATLWPQIVLINNQEPAKPVQWVNVTDVQDIVGGRLNFFTPSETGSVGGLTLNDEDNIRWSDQLTPATAHTSYWKAKKGKKRLINSMIDWFEGGTFTAPQRTRHAWISGLIYIVTVVAVVVLLLYGLAALIWGLKALFLSMGVDTLSAEIARLLSVIPEGNFSTVVCELVPWLALGGVVIVVVSSVVRWLWEWKKFGSKT